MKVEEIISSGLLESYLLGTCTAEESAMIANMCQTHPELLAEIERIEQGLISYAVASAPELPDRVKEKVFDALNKREKIEENIINLPKSNDSKLRLYQFGMAASLLLFVSSLVYNILLQQRVGKLNGELAELSASKSYLAQEIKIQQASISSINQRLSVVTNPGVKNITLNGMNSLLNKAATVYWNTKTEEVYFNISGLPDSPNAKQYQLWAIVDGKPVDAGVIDMSSGDNVFQKMKSIKGASAFAVTIEKTGGSISPSLETMCLLGNV